MSNGQHSPISSPLTTIYSPGVIHDGVQSMSYGQYSPISSPLTTIYSPGVIHDGVQSMSYGQYSPISSPLTTIYSPGVVHDGVQSMSYGQYSPFSELLTDGFLNKLVRLQVNCGCGFIQNQDFTLPQERTCKTHQLPLTNAAGKSDLTKLWKCWYPSRVRNLNHQPAYKLAKCKKSMQKTMD